MVQSIKKTIASRGSFSLSPSLSLSPHDFPSLSADSNLSSRYPRTLGRMDRNCFQADDLQHVSM